MKTYLISRYDDSLRASTAQAIEDIGFALIEPVSGTVLESVRRAIAEADLVVVLVPKADSAWVAFEAGIAVALDKPMMVFRREYLPSFMTGYQSVRVDGPSPEAALRGALEIFRLANSDRLTSSPASTPTNSPALDQPVPSSPATPTTPADLREALAGWRSRDPLLLELEKLVGKCLDIAGGTSLFEGQPDQGFDFAVFIPGLEDVLGGDPLLVEVKSTVRNRRQILDRVATEAQRLGARLAMVVSGREMEARIDVVEGTIVLTVDVDQLIQLVEKGELTYFLRDVRNRAAHGRM